MKVDRTKPVQDVERTAPPTDQQQQPAVKTAPAVADRVSVGEERKVDELVRATKSKAGALRASKLEQIVAAVRKGVYRPDAGRIADQILQAAEIDARLRAMLDKG